MFRATLLWISLTLAASCESRDPTDSTANPIVGTVGLQIENQFVLSPGVTIRVKAGSFDTVLTAASFCHTVGLMTADESRPLAVPRAIPVEITPVLRFGPAGMADSTTIVAPAIGPDSSLYVQFTVPQFRPTDVDGEAFGLRNPSRPAGLDSVWIGVSAFRGPAYDKGPCTR